MSAQSYDATVGLRMGTDWGISGQLRVAKKVTIEGILQSSLFREEVLLTAIAEKHNPVLTRRFNVYYGAGLHKGWINSDNLEIPVGDPAGITMIVGIEMTLFKMNISYDFKPAINLVGGQRKFYTQSGITFRYVVAKKNQLFKKKKKRKKRNNKGKKKFLFFNA